MRILYVMMLEPGFDDLLFEGLSEARGMPAFVRPLKKLFELGNQVDFVIGTATPNIKEMLNIGPPWLKSCRYHFVYWNSVGLQRVLSFYRMYRKVENVLRSSAYDFVYGHGTVGSIGCVLGSKHSIPCGLRLYGVVNLANELANKPRIYTILRHPLQYLSFAGSKNFMIVTNDGTRGDLVYKSLARKASYNFHFLLNGVERIPKRDFPKVNYKKKRDGLKVLFCPSRIEPRKQQHLAIEILERLHAIGHNDVYLYFAGHISDPDYWHDIQAILEKKRISNFVKYLGAIGKEQLLYNYQNSIATLSLCNFSNLGNVTIEALSSGANLIALNDGSLDGIIQNGVNGILIDSAQEGAERISDLIQCPDLSRAMREAAIRHSEKMFLTWGERINIEVQFIYQAVRESIRVD